MRSRLFTSLIVALSAGSLSAQLRPTPPLSGSRPRPTASVPSPLDEDNRSGPRVGVAALIGGSVTAEAQGHPIAPITTLFGWQIEHQFSAGPDVPTPMTELVALVGGMEQGVFLPSVSWMVGMRKTNGWEAGIGPTLTGAGLQVAVAAGVTHAFGSLNVPVNVAIAPGRRGAAISVTTGFNMRHQ